MDSLFELLKANPLFQGGLALGAIGALAAYLRKVPLSIYTAIKRRIMYTVLVRNDDDAYNWLENWVTKYITSSKNYRLSAQWMDGEKRTRLLLIPAEGEYFLRHRGHFLWVSTDSEKLDKGNSEKLFLRSINVRVLWGGKGVLEQFLDEAKRDYEERFSSKVCIYTRGRYGEWEVASAKMGRGVESIILPDNVLGNLLEDIVKFTKAESWYTNLGIPYRRGYLLYGPPGNGKTSLIYAIASHFKMNVAVLSLSGSSMDDSELNRALTKLPEDCILCIEDVDAVFTKDREQKSENKLSFSGLLNALDGIAAQDGRILFMTTNFRDQLDSALIRPGRADLHILIDNATRDQAKRLFERFYPGVDGTTFANKITDGKYSMARLQEYLLTKTSQGAVDDVGEL